MYKGHEIIVFGIDHYNPLGIIRSLGEKGINPVFICIKGKAKVASSSKYISRLYNVDNYIEGCELLLSEFGNCPKEALPIVITSDDEQVGYIDEHYDEFKNKFIIFNAGKVGQITKYMNKYNILKLAKKAGLNILDSCVVEKGEIPSDLQYPVITKSIAPNVGGWKSDVFICQNKVELKNAYKKIKAPRVLIQRFIDKKNEYCLDGISINRGEDIFIAIESTYKYLIKGYYSPYHTIANFNNKQIESALKKMFKEIGFEGIFSIEFLIDKNNNYYFSEINFRNSTWSYSATTMGMNLILLWIKGMLSGKIPKNCKKMIPEGSTAMVEPIDYQKRVVERGYSLENWLKDFKNADCKYYYNEKDPAPFFVMLENNQILR